MVLVPSSAAARESTCRQWRERVEQRVATIPAIPKGLPSIVMDFWASIL
jgi:hypothetical protein